MNNLVLGICMFCLGSIGMMPGLTDPPAQLTDAQQYFLEISFSSEYGNRTQRIRKWRKDMRLFVADTSYTHLNAELDSLLLELNALSGRQRLYRVDSYEEANFVVFFGDPEIFVDRYEPNAADYIENNYGLVWVHWNSDWEIYRGSMYVDVDRTSREVCEKHLLREELTQSLGLLMDSERYEESIFYQQWNCTTRYADIDREVIAMIQDDRIRPGMLRADVLAAFETW